MRRFAVGLAAVALAGAAALVGWPVPAYASGCASASAGVTVVVDFGRLGGGVVVACAAGNPTSGYAALHAAGFSTAGTQRDGPAFACRINGKPTPAQDACVVTPPTTAYWAYWHAKPGGSWSYSSVGFTAYDPAPGTVEGWAFGAGASPGIAPPRLPAPKPTPRPTTPKPTAPRNPPPATTSTTPPASPRAPTGGANPTPSATPGGPTDSPTDSPTPSPSDQSPRDESTIAVATEPPRGGGPGALGTLLGIGVIVILAGAATVVAVRRRQSG